MTICSSRCSIPVKIGIRLGTACPCIASASRCCCCCCCCRRCGCRRRRTHVRIGGQLVAADRTRVGRLEPRDDAGLVEQVVARELGNRLALGVLLLTDGTSCRVSDLTCKNLDHWHRLHERGGGRACGGMVGVELHEPVDDRLQRRRAAQDIVTQCWRRLAGTSASA